MRKQAWNAREFRVYIKPQALNPDAPEKVGQVAAGAASEEALLGGDGPLQIQAVRLLLRHHLYEALALLRQDSVACDRRIMGLGFMTKTLGFRIRDGSVPMHSMASIN